MYEKSHEIIQTFLKKGDAAIDVDKKLFTQYIKWEINLKTTMDKFKENNSIPDADFEKIKAEDFERWMEELGYKRY